MPVLAHRDLNRSTGSRTTTIHSCHCSSIANGRARWAMPSVWPHHRSGKNCWTAAAPRLLVPLRGANANDVPFGRLYFKAYMADKAPPSIASNQSTRNAMWAQEIDEHSIPVCLDRHGARRPHQISFRFHRFRSTQRTRASPDTRHRHANLFLHRADRQNAQTYRLQSPASFDTLAAYCLKGGDPLAQLAITPQRLRVTRSVPRKTVMLLVATQS